MYRTELGLRLCSWHSSMSDPIYAVGSFYVSDQRYPKAEIVDDCLHNLRLDVDERKRMLAGEKVSRWNSHYGRMIEDQRAFSGYTDDELKADIADLEEIIAELELFKKEDYRA